jgi:hypothetical protein
VGLALLVLGTAVAAQMRGPDDAVRSARHEPLALRVRAARALIGAADYYLGFAPRVVTLWHWQISVRRAEPDPRAAWDAIRRIPLLLPDDPLVPAAALVAHIQRHLVHVRRAASRARQASAPYTADYMPVRTLLDTLATDLSPAPLGLAGSTSHAGACPVCALE